MAETRFYIPGSTSGIWTPAGTLKLEIFYSGNDQSTDLDVPILRVSPIRYQFEVDPSAKKYRFGTVKIRLFNKDNLIESSGILNSSKRDETFLRLYLNNAVFFTGILKWDLIKKYDWYLDNGTLKYREIELPFADVLAFAATKTLADVSYSDDIYFETLWRNIAGLLKLTNISILEDFLISENRGAQYSLSINQYDDGLRLAGLNSTMNLLDFIKKAAMTIGGFVFQFKDTLWFRQRDITANSTTIANEQILEVAKIPVRNPVKYVEISATKKWTDAYGGSVAIDDVTYTKAYGTKSPINKENIVIDATELLSNLCVPTPSGGNEEVPGGTNYPTAVDTTNYEWLADTLYADFLNATDWVESGMLLRVDNGGYKFFSITDATADTLYFKNPTAFSFSTSNPYSVFRRKTAAGAFPNYTRLFKVYKGVLKAAAIYNKFFINAEMMRFVLRGFIDLQQTINWNGKNYVPYRVQYDLKSDKMVVEAVGMV